MSQPPAPADGHKPAVLRPRDAATLILVDSTTGLPRILLGKRRMDMKFMPGKYVFPGGRVDRADRTVAAADELNALEVSKLLIDMKGEPNALRARALGLAAIRETFEEAGLVIGATAAGRSAPSNELWARFFAHGYAPRLGPLTFFARAITPPGRPRRFDTRFFCVDAAAIVRRVDPPENELSDLVWMPIEDARQLDLPPITRVILEDLADRLRSSGHAHAPAPVPYYYQKNGTFRRELISPDTQPESSALPADPDRRLVDLDADLRHARPSRDTG